MTIDPTELNLTLSQIQQALNLLKAFQNAQHIMTQVAHAEGAVTDAEIRKQQIEKDIAGLHAVFEQAWHEHKRQVDTAWAKCEEDVSVWKAQGAADCKEKMDAALAVVAEVDRQHAEKVQAYTALVQKEIEATQTHETGIAARRDVIQQLEDRQAYCQFKADEALRAQQSAENMHLQRVAAMQEEEQGLQKQVDRLNDLLGSLKAVAAKMASE